MATTDNVHPSGDNRFKLLDRTINKHQQSGNSLIEVMHAAQQIFGFLEEDVLIYIAHKLHRPQSQVYGVATFYNYFRMRPPGKHTVVLCTGTACYVKGAAALQNALEHHCGCKFGETSKNGAVSLVTARCIGSCGLAPVAVLDDTVAGKLSPERAVAQVAAWVDGETAASPSAPIPQSSQPAAQPVEVRR